MLIKINILILKKKNDNSNFQNLHIFSIEHEALYKSGTLMFLDNKIIGIGPRLFKFECKNKDYYVNIFSCNNHPHNSYIQLLAETGILGFLIIFFIFIIITISFFKHFFYKLYKKKIIFNDFQIALMTCIFISLWPFIPTGNFFGNWLNAIYYLPLGFLLNSFKKDNFMVKKFIN